MLIKYAITRLVEKITGRKCRRCRHCHGGRCCHKDGSMFMRCWQSITKPGYEKREDGREAWCLSPEEEDQLQKIKGVLDDAEEYARESGLLEEN